MPFSASTTAAGVLGALIMSPLAALAAPSNSLSMQPTINSNAAPPASGSYVLDSNSDEFDTALSSTKWATSLDGWAGAAPAFFSDGAVTTNGKDLMLQQRYAPVPEDLAGCECGFENITTGMVVSKNAFKYGFFEVSANIPPSDFQTAFWLQGLSGEVNIIEASPGKEEMGHTCFTPGQDQVSSRVPVPTSAFSAPSPDVDFHTYGLSWDAAGLTYYIDGEQVHTVESSSVADGCLDQDMTVFLSTESSDAATHRAAGTGAADLATVQYFRRWYRATDYPAGSTTYGVVDGDLEANAAKMNDNGNNMQDNGDGDSNDSSGSSNVIIALVATVALVALVVAGALFYRKSQTTGSKTAAAGQHPDLTPSSSRSGSASSQRSLTSLRKVRVAPATEHEIGMLGLEGYTTTPVSNGNIVQAVAYDLAADNSNNGATPDYAMAANSNTVDYDVATNTGYTAPIPDLTHGTGAGPMTDQFNARVSQRVSGKSRGHTAASLGAL